MTWIAQSDSVPEKRSLQTKQKPSQSRIAYLGIRLRLKVHFVSDDKLSFPFMKTPYLFSATNLSNYASWYFTSHTTGDFF